MHPILLLSRGVFHPNFLARRAFQRILTTFPGCEITVLPSPAGLRRRDLSPYAAVILYFHEKSIPPADLDHLRAYVAKGGGLVAVHSAAASCKQQPTYADLLGGAFSAHGPVERFTVQPAPGSALPGAPLQPFALRDERYRHRLDAEVMLDYVSISNGAPEPFAWRRNFGAGRVFYLAAGHTLAAWTHPALQAILAAGLSWSAGSAA